MSGSPFGILEYFGSKKAAEAQSEAASQSNQLQWDMYQTQRADYAPWRQAGNNALSALLGKTTKNAMGESVRFGGQDLLEKGPGKFEASPSYDFALSQGLQGMQRAASSTGRLGSGAYLKDVTGYAKNLASEEYQNFLNRYYQSLNPWFSMAGLGQMGTTGTANAAQNYGNAAGQNALYAGASQAAGILGSTNALSNQFTQGSNIMGNYLTQSMMGRGGGYGGYTPSNYASGWGYSPAGQSYWSNTIAGSPAGAEMMVWL